MPQVNGRQGEWRRQNSTAICERFPTFALSDLMGKNKLAHFAEMKVLRCAIEPEKEEYIPGRHSLSGNWGKDFFGNDNPITLELGCGKGEYAIALARKYPDRNFIGVDVKGARLWRGCKTVEEEGLPNVAFLRIRIEFVHHFFHPGEVEHIWLTFSDPQPKDKKETKRLSGKHFLRRYAKFLAPGGRVHLKTDSSFLYHATHETIAKGEHCLLFDTADLYGEGLERLDADRRDLLQVKTFYEQKFLAQNKPIHYLCFTLNDRLNKNI